MGCSPAQAAFGRDMMFDVPENAAHDTHEYVPSDLVMVSDNDPRRAKLDPISGGLYEADDVRSNGVGVVNKQRYQETIHLRRLRPEMGDSVIL
ncbi:hypothetical protein GN244_ATG01135 [Phytophthora infestans]|uniref:Uncharacterized protein n=1 Tax=Phytophthora infestans TaxID=4787 RepID=A0A833W8M3_PHYIN|nr:hypothetical protein GN244_ATG01135 [Phytophthora infestans]KAF4137402.1 hypothetical protein GN958_ATG13411 [Phytophthora infestans]